MEAKLTIIKTFRDGTLLVVHEEDNTPVIIGSMEELEKCKNDIDYFIRTYIKIK